MSRIPLRIVAAATLLAIGGCGSSSPTSSSSGTTSSATAPVTRTAPATTETVTRTAQAQTAAGQAPCTTPHLTLSFGGGQGAAGTAYLTYFLKNTGTTACTMIGYPGVAILDSSGRIVQHPATRATASPTPVRLVTLNPGARAQFVVNSTDVIPSPGCPHAYTGTTLQVIPPNQRTPLRLPDRNAFCNLRVGPVAPAA
jgi:Protein of unknown function (DUF4232)